MEKKGAAAIDDDGNFLVNFNDLKDLIEPSLIVCKICKIGKLTLKKVQISGLCTRINMCCAVCEDNDKMDRNKLGRIQ